jgi:serine/threonine-protein kinase
VDPDATEADPAARERGDDTVELATQAASPTALAEAAAQPAGTTGDARPSVWATASHRPVPTAAEALDRSDLRRMRAFHTFGMSAPLGAIALSLMIGGDPLARVLFWAGAGLLAIANMFLVWATSKPERYGTRRVSVAWILSTVGIQGAVYYFGPFSAVVMVLILGIVFISLGRGRGTAIATAAICVGGHLAMALPMAFGWITDVGILSSFAATGLQLIVAETLILTVLVASYLLGRWARKSNAAALAELQSAMRVIGDQQQVMAEQADAARAQRANEGRWTGAQMGGFRLGLVLGRGAMGEVYEATGPDNVPGAVKLLNARATASSSLVERFHREMEVAAKLRSPNIVRVFELSPPDAPVPFIAMERLFGVDLATKLRGEPRLPSDELVVLLDQVARGLEVARVAGVVHRDLKPHNLFLHEGATWKILDFGVSKVMDSEGTLTGEGIVGTPQYMAPEQAQGGHVTHLADVYALGAIAYRCLTGRSPFKGKDLAELIYQVVHKAPVRPSVLGRVSGALDDVLAVAMAKDPRRRFPSAVSFAQAFVAARRGKSLAIEAPPDAWQ